MSNNPNACPQMKENQDLACFHVTKLSWKGKYKRIFSIGTQGITTYNPQTLEITNQWLYSDFFNILPNPKGGPQELIIQMKKVGGNKKDQMKFASDHRADILTEALRFQHQFAETPRTPARFNAFKQHWSDTRKNVVLAANSAGLCQFDPVSNSLLCTYDYKDIECLLLIPDLPGGISVVCGGFGRNHIFATQDRDNLIKAIKEAAQHYIGLQIRVHQSQSTYEQLLINKFGKYSGDEHLTSHSEFPVAKTRTPRHKEPVRRLLCLSETCLIERDPATYHAVSVKPLCDVFSMTRDPANPQLVAIESVRGPPRYYTSTDRDALIASVLDGVRASGNRDVCVKRAPIDRGLRFGPLSTPLSEEVESQCLRHLYQQPPGAVARFNANVPYSGLLHAVTQDGFFSENKERLITQALSALIHHDGGGGSVEAEFHALRRLVASRAGFSAFTDLSGMRETLGRKVVAALRRADDDGGVGHAAIDTINSLMQPMHDNYDLKQEQLNKSSIMSSKKFLESLLDIFEAHVLKGTGALFISAMLDFLTFALCAPYSETTEGGHFDTLLIMTAARGRAFFKLFQHPSTAILKGAGLVMRSIVEEAEPEVAARMQALSLAEAALPAHLHTALFTQSADGRMLVNRQLSRHLIGLWVTDNQVAMTLLRRIFPQGLLSYLDSTEEPPRDDIDRLNTRDNLKLATDQENQRSANQQWRAVERQIENFLVHWRSRIGFQKKQPQKEEKPIVLRKRRQRVKSEANWAMFYYQFCKDHTKPNLLWNYRTREELREALDNELRAFNSDKDLSGKKQISWNHEEFQVAFPSLAEEIKIGDYFLRVLLEEDDKLTGDEESTLIISQSFQFFNDLYHRFLLTQKVNMKCMCLHAMTIVYGRATLRSGRSETLATFMLERTTDKLERDRLMLFLSRLVLNKENVKEILDANGVKIIIDFVTLAHLHISRAHTPMQSNILEASPDMRRPGEKEWYYGSSAKERCGPFSFDELKELFENGSVNKDTRVWAQGFEGWKPLASVPQLRWTLLATGKEVLNESDLAVAGLNILIRMCEFFPSTDQFGAVIRPLPRVKTALSSGACLPHLVQLLLTFDSVLVEKVATLLNHMMVENPYISRLYLTGVFFFILMYSGSNLIPIAQFLKYTHLLQAFRTEEAGHSLMQQSVLGHLLPEAMVCYLENYTPEKFAEIFLGEFDTPEAIWNSEMRRLMISKIAAHLADFSPRLQSNTRALYQYCAIPRVQYPQLENELFCNIYYLRHLCDTARFPDWPIKEPIALLKDILEAWKREVEKRPPTMSLEEAYSELGLTSKDGAPDEAQIRKSYFRLAQKYHPDKNPDGREKFESVNKAYEFFGPDPKNIVLILRSQSILFSRYKDLLQPYKYAGYPALIKTVRMETSEDQLFSKEVPLLESAAELCYHTVNCSNLNAEELRRENGIEALQEAFSRCVSVITPGSKPDETPARVCVNILRCFTVAAKFEACRSRIQEQPQIVKDLLRVMYFKHLPRLATVAVVTFCLDFWLQTNMYQSGALYHLLPLLFGYDYTLDEGGVERAEDSNQQEQNNRLAEAALRACSALAGYRAVATSPTVAVAVDSGEPGRAEASDDVPAVAADASNSSSDGGACYPDNPSVQQSLKALVTPFVCRRMQDQRPGWLLKLLNSNCQTPYFNLGQCDQGRTVGLFGGPAAESDSHCECNGACRAGECDQSLGTEFQYSIFGKELIIGDVFIRVYNEQPTYPLENPKGLTIDILHYLNTSAQYLHSLLAMQRDQQETLILNDDQRRNLTKVDAALEALRNVIRNHPGVEMQCIGYFQLLFALLRLNGCHTTMQRALEVISCVTENQECVKDIAAANVLCYLVMLFQTLPECHGLLLSTLSPLMSHTDLVKDSVYRGVIIHLLDLFCSSSDQELRQQAAQLLAKLTANKLVGPRIRLILNKFLPAIFVDAMRDAPETAVNMFETSQENPELLWNDDTRSDSDGRQDARRVLPPPGAGPGRQVEFPEDFRMPFIAAGDSNDCVGGEPVVGGVYLRLFVQNPGWVLRNPKEFTRCLMDKWIELVRRGVQADAQLLELVTSSMVGLVATQPALLDSLPQLGYFPQLLDALATSEDAGALRSCLLMLHAFSANTGCVRSLVSAGHCLRSVKRGMEQRPDLLAYACETVLRLAEGQEDLAAEQALTCGLVQHLLGLLQSGLERVENPGATKAQVVNALKALQKSLQHGE
uniref:J domain-containing protein n=1 Tax=Macrostomum lignano TaxID=282301 RepID=A0A1I8HXS4_9PLAT